MLLSCIASIYTHDGAWKWWNWPFIGWFVVGLIMSIQGLHKIFVPSPNPIPLQSPSKLGRQSCRAAYLLICFSGCTPSYLSVEWVSVHHDGGEVLGPLPSKIGRQSCRTACLLICVSGSILLVTWVWREYLSIMMVVKYLVHCPAREAGSRAAPPIS